MAATKQLISTVTVGSSGAASIELSSIPSSFTDLLLVISAREKNIADFRQPIFMTFNSNTSGYSDRILLGNGASVSSTSNSYGAGSFVMNGYANGQSSTSNTFASISTYVPNYAGSNNKSISSDSVTENNATSALQGIQAQLWTNTAAITSIQLTTYTEFAQYSTASLYGITSGNGGATVS
jgi:hypothetical protein